MPQMHIESYFMPLNHRDPPSNATATRVSTPLAAKCIAQRNDPVVANGQTIPSKTARATAWVIEPEVSRPLAPRPVLTRSKAQAPTEPVKPSLIRSRTWTIDSPAPSITRPTVAQPSVPQQVTRQAETQAPTLMAPVERQPAPTMTFDPFARTSNRSSQRHVRQQPDAGAKMTVRSNTQTTTLKPKLAPLAQTLARLIPGDKPLEALLRSVIQLNHDIARQHGETAGGKQSSLIDSAVKTQLKELDTRQTQKILGLLDGKLKKSARAIGLFASTQQPKAKSRDEALKLRALSRIDTVLSSVVKALNLKLKIPTSDQRNTTSEPGNLSREDRDALAKVLGASVTQVS